MTIQPTLTVHEMRRHFDGLDVLAGVSLELRPGELVAIVGGNGSGKTTLLNLVSGVDRPDAGSVRLRCGEMLVDVTRWPIARRARSGVLQFFQRPSLWRNLTAIEHIALARLASGMTGWLRRPATVAPQLKRMALSGVGGCLAAELSYGQSKLVALSSLLAMSMHRVLLLDEPLAGLSTEMAVLAVEAVCELRKTGAAVLVVEHERLLGRWNPDRVCELRAGRLGAT